MDRRTLLTAALPAVYSSVAGCLEHGDTIGNSNDPRDTSEADESDMNHSADDGNDSSDGQPDQASTDDGQGDLETQFEVLSSDYESQPSSSVAFENKMLTVTGTILGSNTCYTANLETVIMESETLYVNVRSYEDTDKNEGCRDAEISIEYEAVIEFDSELPTTVSIKHNGEQVVTEQRA